MSCRIVPYHILLEGSGGMATPIGHIWGGVGAYAALAPQERLTTKRTLLVAALAVSPDVDVVLLFLGIGQHRGWTHSLLFCGVVAFVAWLLAGGWRSKSSGRLFLAFFATTVSHLFLDWLMHCGPPIHPFLPFSNRGFNCPVQLIPTAYYATSPSGLVHILLTPETLLGVVLETISLGPLAGLAFLLRSGEKDWKTIIPLAALSLCGFLTTFILYN